jgi:hypothetical protein
VKNRDKKIPGKPLPGVISQRFENEPENYGAFVEGAFVATSGGGVVSAALSQPVNIVPAIRPNSTNKDNFFIARLKFTNFRGRTSKNSSWHFNQ